MINNRLVLIDAFALIYRAYFALPPTLTRDGQPVHAVYGFASALLNAIRTLQAEYLAVGMDKGKSHRIKDFDKYKIHRKPTPDDLISQLPYVVEVLKTMNIPTFAVEGYEGEDIIATIVAKIKNQKSNIKIAETIIVTGDMDLLQLITDDIKVYSMARGVNQAVMYNKEKVVERYGLEPVQFIDYKALRGDASDNIPGVKGIGEKTATKLIQEFGSLEKIYEAMSNVKLKMSNQEEKINDETIKKIHEKTKIKENTIRLLLENKEQAFLSQKLATIVNNAPLDFTLAHARIHKYDKKKVIALFNDLGFKSLISRLPVPITDEPLKLF